MFVPDAILRPLQRVHRAVNPLAWVDERTLGLVLHRVISHVIAPKDPS